jgi:hypothetical protein
MVGCYANEVATLCAWSGNLVGWGFFEEWFVVCTVGAKFML